MKLVCCAVLLSLAVQAAPRTDGVYVPEAVVALVDSKAVSAAELGFVEYLAFTPQTLTVHFVLEAQTQSWRLAKAGLEVKDDAGDWSPLPWAELADGTVETDRGGSLERLRFVKGTIEARTRAAQKAFTRAQLQRLAGKYGSGADALTLDATGGQWGKKRFELSALQCFPGCASRFPAVCLESKELVLLETEEGLLRLPREFALCGNSGAGLETAGGVPLRRARKLASRGAGLPQKLLEEALTARASALRACNPTAAPRKVKLEVAVERSGLLRQVSTEEPPLSECLGVALSRLTFPVQGTPSSLSLEWTLASP